MHILVVEDEETIRDAMCDALRVLKHECEAAANGAEALQQMRARCPDAVFVDLMMPGMGGKKFIEVCQQDPSTAVVPFALVSAVPNLAEIAKALHAGAWVVKPFDLVDLWAAAAKLEGPHTGDRRAR
jgi:CheY-like chemotaxis protein